MKKHKSARECALFLLEYRDRTEQQMRQKLKEREYEPQEIEEALSFLKEYRYIDDADYAERYIRVYSCKKSARQIRFDLERKGIARDVVEQYLEETPVDEESQIREYLRKKGCRPGERLDAAVYKKITAGLCRKGFSYEVIRRVMDGVLREDE